MKFKSLAFAFLVIPIVATAAQAQNLFRTARPAYTRDYPATYHDRYLANSYRTDRSNDFDYDREQLNRARENYRAEANRYQTRYGSNYSDGYGTASSPSSYDSVRPVGYESDYAPNRRCSRKPDLMRERLPATSTPSGYYNPSYYDNSFGNRNSSGFGNNNTTGRYADPYGTNVNLTASRPLVSLFDSLFGTNR